MPKFKDVFYYVLEYMPCGASVKQFMHCVSIDEVLDQLTSVQISWILRNIPEFNSNPLLYESYAILEKSLYEDHSSALTIAYAEYRAKVDPLYEIAQRSELENPVYQSYPFLNPDWQIWDTVYRSMYGELFTNPDNELNTKLRQWFKPIALQAIHEKFGE